MDTADKIAQYQQIIQTIFQYHTARFPKDDPIETQLVFDTERHHYLMRSVGWQKASFLYGPLFHIDIKPDGKVSVQ